MIIQVPGLRGRVLHDATNATSVNLAPTIAHIMELPNQPTPWVGKSIFERRLNVFADRGIASYPDFRYQIIGDKLFRIGLSDQPTIEEKAINRFFNFSARLEELNRVWPARSSLPFTDVNVKR